MPFTMLSYFIENRGGLSFIQVKLICLVNFHIYKWSNTFLNSIIIITTTTATTTITP